jgi:2'-5' RNA ligase
MALWPDAGTRRRIDAQARAIELSGRLVPAGNLHMTLVFVGNVAADRAGALACIVRNLRAPAFDLRLDRLGHFAGARVAWAGCGAVPQALKALQAALESAVREAGFAVERRAFRPHVTLARDVRAPLSPGDWPAIDWTAREVVLARSDPGPGGVRYRVVCRRDLD